MSVRHLFKLKTFIIFCGISFSCFQANAQGRDTLVLSLSQLETRFINNNLRLIAQQYNIDKVNAETITAKLFPNPVLSFSNGLYSKSPDTNAFSQQTYSFSQLLLTAGKRNKAIQLSKINLENAKNDFFDLLRTLKYSLRIDFFSLYSLEESIALYKKEIKALEKTHTAFKILYQKGNVSQKELLRIQSLMYALQAEHVNLMSQANALQGELRQLIRADKQEIIKPNISFGLIDSVNITKISYQRLLDSALLNRQDLKLARSSDAQSRRDVTYYSRADINVVSASYIKMRDITLSYSLPSLWIKKLKADQVTLRAQVSNIMLWKANNDGIDPEFQEASLAFRNLRINQGSVSFGLNVKF
ncbi:TolC family protein [Pedobacter sp. MR22-3]|uniref:TolC family protein n=1 Tax=Pedobacter sp. MR22-3 TaxID=2994552 RepID=UPI00224795CF|nr:TolC family protein [Pedobacter sp. MR22-3]MCX2584737.1 TolC family protein [Pedobacter sp. MR22-3]